MCIKSGEFTNLLLLDSNNSMFHIFHDIQFITANNIYQKWIPKYHTKQTL